MVRSADPTGFHPQDSTPFFTAHSTPTLPAEPSAHPEIFFIPHQWDLCDDNPLRILISFVSQEFFDGT